jgi:hypothetical protein
MMSWSDEYIHTDDSVYSDRYGYYLLVDNAVEVIEDLDSDGDVSYQLIQIGIIKMIMI